MAITANNGNNGNRANYTNFNHFEAQQNFSGMPDTMPTMYEAAEQYFNTDADFWNRATKIKCLKKITRRAIGSPLV